MSLKLRPPMTFVIQISFLCHLYIMKHQKESVFSQLLHRGFPLQRRISDENFFKNYDTSRRTAIFTFFPAKILSLQTAKLVPRLPGMKVPNSWKRRCFLWQRFDSFRGLHEKKLHWPVDQPARFHVFKGTICSSMTYYSTMVGTQI